MNDKEIMEGLLVCAKQSCDLLLHGSIESATPKVHGTSTPHSTAPSACRTTCIRACPTKAGTRRIRRPSRSWTRSRTASAPAAERRLR